MTDYSKLKARFPNAKVGNIKRLIAAIRRSEGSDGAVALWRAWRDDARRDTASGPQRISRHCIDSRGATSRRIRAKADTNVSGRGSGRVGFSMNGWINIYESDHECGTCACIGGFAYLLGDGRDAETPPASIKFDEHFADFIGIDYRTIKGWSTAKEICIPSDHRMSDVRPRHAVALLERFLETGVVEWDRAMGINSRTGDPTNREMRERRREDRKIAAARRRIEGAAA